MPTGAITNYIDVAQLTLYVFWFFFFALVFWIRREDKREGYPVEYQRTTGVAKMEGFPPLPKPKTFILPHTGRKVVKPGPEPAQYKLNAAPIAPFPGAALAPIGDPMLAAVGPGSYAIRAEEPDLTDEGEPRIVPLRVATHFSVADKDPDPRGMPVVGCDGEQGGVCKELWIDRAEPCVRYLELEAAGGKRVLVPMALSQVRAKKGLIEVRSLKGEHFKNAPTLKSYDQITLAEEDKVVAYCGAGQLYATPDRAEPYL
ncbi:photosynthetic reaction center subunit H [Thiohalocapsa marina]|uniref:Photosynthetic reaction center subunit H n=1 Tax=Thiohalocapsa marina TaxID=424902 RepID=A0A5M8FDU2_9GAMM|nr:photosynthetic reaction center subunit H [Thiohalocapsa marina]KAA6182837.1 photosynthetic reaction center subunit H [Thiohalocapsa marina]